MIDPRMRPFAWFTAGVGACVLFVGCVELPRENVLIDRASPDGAAPAMNRADGEFDANPGPFDGPPTADAGVRPDAHPPTPDAGPPISDADPPFTDADPMVGDAVPPEPDGFDRCRPSPSDYRCLDGCVFFADCLLTDACPQLLAMCQTHLESCRRFLFTDCRGECGSGNAIERICRYQTCRELVAGEAPDCRPI